MDSEQLESALAAFRRAVAKAGSQSALERAAGVKQQNTSNWLRAGKPIAPEHVIAVEEATGISRHDLRPDIYPRPSRRSLRGSADEERTPAHAADRAA
jgi:DNA-binding transcriptional regulator YdaS (Cro superfamily)